MNESKFHPRIIIVGAGFGGIFAAKTLAGKPVDVLLIDSNNYHTFTPLLYQVASSALDPSEIAYPIRGIFKKSENIDTMMGNVVDLDKVNHIVTIEVGEKKVVEKYDYLILAAGSVPTYFGNDHLAENSFELRTLDDAIKIRNHILRLFERALWMPPSDQRTGMTTIVVVGGGPTGLELSGALYELYNHVLEPEYCKNHCMSARVILVERMDELLAPYPEKLRIAAMKQLKSLGVEVITGQSVEDISEDHIVLEDGSEILTQTVIWTAGVQASRLAERLGSSLSRRGTLTVMNTLSLLDEEKIFTVGDVAYLEDSREIPYPMLIPVAKQQGILAAKNILRNIHGEEQKPFSYKDGGIMATIGRRRAVAWIYNKIPLTGFIAWIAWLFLHLLSLMGFRNKLNVLVNWVWNYFTFDRSVRIVLD